MSDDNTRNADRLDRVLPCADWHHCLRPMRRQPKASFCLQGRQQVIGLNVRFVLSTLARGQTPFVRLFRQCAQPIGKCRIGLQVGKLECLLVGQQREKRVPCRDETLGVYLR